MTSDINGETTESPKMLGANQTLMNFTDEHLVDDESVLVDEDELLFYFALYKITVPTAFAIIILVGLLGNLLVVVVTLSRHKMWTTVNLLLLNLHPSIHESLHHSLSLPASQMNFRIHFVTI